jgi:hypothetical protein
MKGKQMSDYRPGYSHGGIMPMATARWLYAHPVESVSLSPELFNGNPMLRLHSGDTHRDVHCNWGLEVADQRHRPAVMRMENGVFNDIEAVIQWEARQAPVFVQAAGRGLRSTAA